MQIALIIVLSLILHASDKMAKETPTIVYVQSDDLKIVRFNDREPLSFNISDKGEIAQGFYVLSSKNISEDVAKYSNGYTKISVRINIEDSALVTIKNIKDAIQRIEWFVPSKIKATYNIYDIK